MKKLLGLTVAALMVMALVGGGTWAYFSDTETSTGNTFTAGTLNLTSDIAGDYSQPNNVNGVMTPTDGGDGVNDSVTFDKIAPGDSGTITWTLTNVGNLKGYLALVASVTGNTNDTNEPEDYAIAGPDHILGNGDDITDLNLADLMGVKLTRNIAGAGETYILGSASNYVPLSELEDAVNLEVNKAMDEAGPGNDNYVYKFYWSIASDVKEAGDDGWFGATTYGPDGIPDNEDDAANNDDVQIDDNILQTDTATINISFYLDQVSGVEH